MVPPRVDLVVATAAPLREVTTEEDTAEALAAMAAAAMVTLAALAVKPLGGNSCVHPKAWISQFPLAFRGPSRPVASAEALLSHAHSSYWAIFSLGLLFLVVFSHLRGFFGISSTLPGMLLFTADMTSGLGQDRQVRVLGHRTLAYDRRHLSLFRLQLSPALDTQ